MDSRIKIAIGLWALILGIFFFIVFAPTKTVTLLNESFWEHHNIIQLIGWICFPRIMFWFFSVITGGVGFWIGVLLAPHIMAAFWATKYYWDTNPVLCIFAWIFAILGSLGESKVAT